jgi:hypothetical protein
VGFQRMRIVVRRDVGSAQLHQQWFTTKSTDSTTLDDVSAYIRAT